MDLDLRATLDLLPVGVAHFDFEGRFRRVNQRLCEIVGLEREALLTTTFQAISFPDDLERCVALNRELADGEIPRYVHEKRFVRGTGEIVWTRVTVTLARDASGTPAYFVGVAEDVTAQREAEERLRLALRAADVGTFRWDLASDVLDADETLVRLFALAPAEARSTRVFLDRIHPDDRLRLEEAAARSAEGAEIDEEFRVVCPDGTVRWIRDRARTIRDGDGTPLCVTGACADVTVRRELDASLREERERFRTLANTIPQLAWTAERDGARLWFNQRWYDYTGTTLADVEGFGWRRLHHPEHAERVLAHQEACFEAGTPWEDVHPLRGKEGGFRWFLSRAVPLRDAAGEISGWFGTNTDITDRLEAEQKAERAVRARDEAIAILAHDLRNPLHAIMLTCSAAATDVEAWRTHAQLIQSSATVIDRLINDLLDVARIESGTFVVNRTAVDARALVAETLELFAGSAAAAAVTLVHESAEAVGRALADGDRLRQVLANLVGNAIKFTGPGGRVAVKAAAALGDVVFVVEDTGCGITPEQLPRAFDRFWKVDGASRSGAGLGLAIAKGIVDAHGGRIWIESAVQQGTRVSFTVPVCT